MDTPEIQDLEKLRARLHQGLGPDLLSSAYRHTWSESNPTAGLCSVASEAAWFILGGLNSPWTPMVVRDGDAGTHWWLENRHTGQRFDPTEEQYRSQGRLPPYERGLPGQGGGFMGIRRDEGSAWGFERKPSNRAQQLLERVLGDQSIAELREELTSVPRPGRRLRR